MIIDFHTHIFPDKICKQAIKTLVDKCQGEYFPYFDGSLPGLYFSMQKNGVDKSVVLPVVTNRKQFESVNLWSKEIESEKIIAFGGIFPDESYKAQIDFVCSLGLKGLKFQCQYQNFILDEPRMLKIYDYAISRNLIIVHHAGRDAGYKPPYNSTPLQFAKLLDELNGGIFVAAHLGGHAQWDDVERHLCGRDIYLDTSMGFEYYSKEQFLRICKRHGTDKILFATDSPWSDPGFEIQKIMELPLENQEKEKILGGNAQKLIGASYRSAEIKN